MARRKREPRIMWRHQGGTWRAYADFRDYANVGGRRQALILHGETMTTTDHRQAEQLMARRLGELQALREGRSMADTVTPVGIAELKNRYSKRIVPLWPRLEEILRHYVFDVRVRQPGRLLFPSFVAGHERMLTDFRKLLDRVAVRAGILTAVLDPNTGKQRRTEKGQARQRIWTGRYLRTRLFRHT